MNKFLAVLLFVLSASFAFAAEGTMNLSVFGGLKFMDSRWGQNDEQRTGAIRFDIGDKVWFANIAVDYYVSDYKDMHFDNGLLTDFDITTKELRIGLRGYYGNKIRLIYGGGVANIKADIKKHTAAGTAHDKDSTGITFFKNGLWAELGVDYVFDPVIVGFSASYSEGRVECFNQILDAGGWTAGIYLGLHW